MSEVTATEPVDNALALSHLLKTMADNSLTQSDKGTRFEKLVLDYLSRDPIYTDLFSRVQMHADWVAEHNELEINKNDIGIDLVATDIVEEGEKQTYTAIQCKFYAEGAIVPKRGIDSFLAASGKDHFSKRFIIATNTNWNSNVQKQLANQTPPVTIITREDLARSSLLWDDYLKGKETASLQEKRTLRPYQQDALNNVIHGFKTHDRGKLIMACGTGKTFTSLRTAEAQVGQHGFVLFLVPSLSLLSQTLSDWKQQAIHPITAYAVCSDSKIGKIDDLISPSELAYPATTSADDLAKKVHESLEKSNRSANGGMTVVFSTYQSIDVIAVAQNGNPEAGACVDNPMPAFDLIICDEAHRTAGGYLVNPTTTKSYVEATTQTNPLEQSMGMSSSDVADYVPQQSAADATNAASSTASGKKAKGKKGASLKVIDEEEAAFTRIHNENYVKGLKRLYMTATPKVYGTAAREQENAGEAVLYSMDDQKVFGPEFYTMNFETAVREKCLVDYKVLILVGDANTFRTAEEADEFSDNHASRAVGAWKALNKYGIQNDLHDDFSHMRRAVGFAQQINHDSKGRKTSSKDFAEFFQEVIGEYRETIINRGTKYKNLTAEQLEIFKDENAFKEYSFITEHDLLCDAEHIDGSMNALQKASLLNWLREDPQDNHCKILFNVRCLSEGVDVPSLDAVIFLAPRKSQVDVVQTVGRVMRTAPGKKRGYVIIPIVAEDVNNPEKTLDRSEDFKVVWQVLNALKSINPNHVLVDSKLGKIDPRIEVISVIKDRITKKSESEINIGSGSRAGSGDGDGDGDDTGLQPQPTLLQDLDSGMIRVEEAIKSIILKKVGNRKSWEEWAEDVSNICTNQVTNIKQVLENNDHPDVKQCFNDFKNQMSAAINGHITAGGVSEDETAQLSDDAFIEMLAQHVVIKPVLDELFKEHPFTEKNVIASALTQMLDTLQEYGLKLATNDLKSFYESVGYRMKNVKTVEDRQAIIVELFDTFFEKAFAKMQNKLGIVYTPVEVVDFINHSVNDILKQEFGSSLGDKGVHILDPFTGTGTFITRMMQDETLIPRDALPYKYRHELHAFELVPLSYYIASINIESVYDELMPNSNEEYTANNITVLTDTFASHDADILPLMSSNIQRNAFMRKQVDELPLKVIIGNPPYSAGQKNQNDHNQNEHYPELEARLQETYVAKAGKISNKNKIYDSYIKAFRWASDKIGDSGVVAFLTNAGWIDSLSANGVRKCFAEEFNSVYVYHLKGVSRGISGETAKKLGSSIFSAHGRNGILLSVAITILVKNPNSSEKGVIRFGCVDDYLNADQKIEQLQSLGSIKNAVFTEITPDEHGDWMNLRRNDFGKFISIDGKKHDGLALFSNFSLGVVSSRDSWSFNSSKSTIQESFETCIAYYNSQVQEAILKGDSFKIDEDQTVLKWDVAQKRDVIKHKFYPDMSKDLIVRALYRPFVKQFFYNDPDWLSRVYQMPKIFPHEDTKNIIIGVTGIAAKGTSSFAACNITSFDTLEKAQWLPRYIYRPADNLDRASDTEIDAHGFVREDAIKPEAVEHFKAAYGDEGSSIDADAVFYYIYGVISSKDYLDNYSNNLKKELPRIPRVATYAEFKEFEEAGRKLVDLHINYESVTPYAGCEIIAGDNVNYRVEKLSYGKLNGKTGNAAKDKTTILYNDTLTIKNIPLETQEYVVNKKSALDWVVKHCGIIEKSGIVNDFNDYAAEVGDEKYIFNLILRVITVSLETMKIVKSLPKLNIHPLDK